MGVGQLAPEDLGGHIDLADVHEPASPELELIEALARRRSVRECDGKGHASQ